MVYLKVIINNKKVINIDADIANNTINDLISKVKAKKSDVSINLITIGGEDVNTNDYNKKLNDYN